MSGRRKALGTFVAVVGVVAALAFGMVGAQVYRITHPPRRADHAREIASVVVNVEEVAFPASDDVRLSGWLLPGDPGMPFIVMVHDLGGSKGTLLDLAVVLQKSGFNLLAFDLRGHGASDGGGSSLGIREKHDVIGAVDYLGGLDGFGDRPIGVYGLGMGAHAAVLAAADRPALDVLVLDGLYPNPTYPLLHRTYGDWTFGMRYLGFLPGIAFAVLNRAKIGDARAELRIARLVGREVLLISPADDNALTSATEAMYATIPEQRDSEGNLVLLPSTRLDGLYGEDLELYENRVLSFFRTRLTAD